MTKSIKKNLEVSIRARLLNISKDTGENFNAILNRFFQERFLARLSRSDFKDFFVLKGGLLLASESISQFRPTIDIDMLAVNIDINVKIVKPMIDSIAQITLPDGVIFDTKNITHQVLKEDAEYEGIRFIFFVYLGKIKSRMQIDIGFGDSVPLGFKERVLPVFLDDLEPPVLLTYPFESVIAEKFQAIIYHGEANSRMKDFYDILFLAKHNEFSMNKLKSALVATFTKRKTDIDKRYFIYDDKYIDLKFRLWSVYLRKINSADSISFVEVIRKIKSFLEPVLKGANVDDVWSIKKWKWEK